MANFNFNKVILGGRLTQDPELRQSTSGIPVTTFSIAVNRRAAKGTETQADFFNVTAWRAQAELVTKFFRKGSSIALSGSIQNRTWTDNNGQKRYSTDIIADEIYFVDSKAEGGDRELLFSPHTLWYRNILTRFLICRSRSPQQESTPASSDGPLPSGDCQIPSIEWDCLIR